MRILACLLFSSFAFASDRQIDLSTGVVFPSDGFAVFENPATLPKYQGGFFDSGFYLDRDVGVVGSLSGDINKQFGFGLGIQRNDATFTFTPALGFSLGNTFFGVSTPIGPQSAFRTFQVGMQVGGKSAPGFAIVARSLPSLSTWSVGIGWGEEGAVRGEVGADLVFDPRFDIQSAIVSAGLALKLTPDLSAVARYRFAVVPTYVFSLAGLELGANYWIGNQTALYVLFQGRYANLIVGAKLKL
jgi:hypothetical protein